MYVEWRRTLGTGTRRQQQASRTLEARTRLMRWYEPLLVPGILHTAEYAEAVMRRVIEFYEIPDDLDAGVSARMERQQILYRSNHKFHFIVTQQALLTTVGDSSVMIGQLDRLLAVMSMPRLTLGIIPTFAEYRVPTNQFIMFDNRLVHVETVSAELTINQPREIAVYHKVFEELAKQAVICNAARALITDETTCHLRPCRDHQIWHAKYNGFHHLSVTVSSAPHLRQAGGQVTGYENRTLSTAPELCSTGRACHE